MRIINPMIIRLAKKGEAEQIAQIHQQEIKTGFLSSLGQSFLKKLYQAIIESDNSFCTVAEIDGQIIGFIAGSANVNHLYRYFLKKYSLGAFITLLPKIFNLRAIRKILESLLYPKKEKKLPKAELLTIAIKNKYQGQGVAGLMFKKFVEEMKNREIKTFKVVVGEILPRAISFYEKMGFQFHSFISIHDKELSRIYTYKIKL